MYEEEMMKKFEVYSNAVHDIRTEIEHNIVEARKFFYGTAFRKIAKIDERLEVRDLIFMAERCLKKRVYYMAWEHSMQALKEISTYRTKYEL